MTRRMRIGLFGGAFNPIHIGHLVLAEAARRQCRLDEVWFIPTAVPPHKSSREMAGGAHRLAMVRLATRGHPAFKVRDMELRRGGVSYTLETVRQVQQSAPRHDWFLIVGSDMLKVRWYGLKELARRCTFVVAHRAGGARGGRFPLLRPSFAKASERASQRRARMRRVAMPRVDLSSAMIRTAIGRGDSVRYLVPEPVRRYLARHRLYQGGR